MFGKIKIVSSKSPDKKIEKGDLGIFSSNIKDYLDSFKGLESLEIPSLVIEKLISDPEYSNLNFILNPAQPRLHHSLKHLLMIC